MLESLKNESKSFLRETSGSATAEVAIVFPLIAFLLVSCITFFDAFSTYRNAQNITYTVSDIVSRYTEFDNVQLNDLNDIFNEVVGNTDANTYLRVTSVSEYFGSTRIDWSTATNGAGAYIEYSDLPASKIPVLSAGETLLIVETSVQWAPFFDWAGITAKEYQSISIVSPRFAGKLEYLAPVVGTG